MNEQALQGTADNRRLVVGVALVSGAVGLVPVPLVGDLLIDAIRASLLRALAERRGLELSRRAALVVVGATDPELGRTALAGLLTLLGRLVGRQLFRWLLVAVRFEDAAKTFVLGTLFDYACQTGRVEALDESQAARLRRALARAQARARIGVLAVAFQRATEDLFKLGAWLPRKLSSLMMALLEGRRAEVEETVELDSEGLFSRLRQALEHELQSTEQALLSNLCQSFEDSWNEEQQHA
jgi:hypothetical protein